MKETRYKDTEIGKIPEEWEVKKLGDIFDIGNGRDYKHLNAGKVPVYGTGGLMTYVNDYLYDGETVCIGRKGTINAPQYHSGKIWTVDTLFYTYNFRGTDIRFLYYLAQIIDWNAYNTATGVPSLTSQNISSILAAFPPLHEQHRIASALTSIDNLISSLGKLIEKKKNVKQGAMQQLLTGETRLKGFSEPWVERKLGEIGYTYNGISGKSANDFGHGNAQYITFLNILNNVKIDIRILEKVSIDNTENQNAVRKGDLFFNTSSETPEEVGICSVLLQDLPNTYLNSFCFGYRIIDSELLGLYLSYYFRSRMGRKLMSCLAQGSTRYNLSKDAFLKSIITIPPTLSEQRAIASILTKMDDEITALEAKKAKYEAVKQGMMQQLLTGKIRLIG